MLLKQFDKTSFLCSETFFLLLSRHNKVSNTDNLQKVDETFLNERFSFFFQNNFGEKINKKVSNEDEALTVSTALYCLSNSCVD